MPRLINADALMELYADRLTAVAERYSPDSSECGILSGAMKLLEIQPTIEERKKGERIVSETGYEDTKAKCSECGFETLVNEPGNGLHMITDLHYCPNYGSYNGGGNEI